MGKRELVALLILSSWCLVIVERLPRGATGCLRFVIVVFPDHTHLLFSWHLDCPVELPNHLPEGSLLF